MSNLSIKNANLLVKKAGFMLKKHSPEILATVGAVGVVTSTVLACKATTKAGDILDETKGQIDQVHEVLNSPEYKDKYSEQDSKRDLTVIYAKTGVKFIKLYGPSVALGVLSIGAMLTSNQILRKRNVALAAAYATVDKGFKEYRKRVIDRFGEQVDQEIKYNLKSTKIAEKEIDSETGKEKTVKKTIDVINPNDVYSPYAKCFDNGCRPWTKDPEANLMFLRQQQNWANDKLKCDGYLFLNDVYDALDFPRTKAGQIVGWVLDPKDTDVDSFVDFGIYEAYNEPKQDFVNGRERSIWLDFNVQGNILDLI